MSLTVDRIPASQTWGGRLARQPESPAPGAEERERPVLELVHSDIRDTLSIVLHYPLPTIVLSRTFGARSAGASGLPVDLWELNNRRRVFLIDKRLQGGLSPKEEVELNELQADFESYLDRVRPLPNHMLDELEALAEQLEAENKQP